MFAKLATSDTTLVAVPGDDADASALATWAGNRAGHVFVLRVQDNGALVLRDIGPQAEACRQPVNIVFDRLEPPLQLVSNLAHTPFEFDGRAYASIEGFWQGLKFKDEARRAEIARLHGHEARSAGFEAPEADTILYEGKVVRVGTHEHWKLMRNACRAKFDQHEGAAAALLSTGERPLVHKVKRDSRTIPGVIMADIWTRIRARLRKRQAGGG